MGRFQIIISSLIAIIIILALTMLPQLRVITADLINRLPFLNEEGVKPATSEQTGTNDKKVCGICHYDKSQDFKKRYQHAPFANWHCTDCHLPHTAGQTKAEFVVQIDRLCASCHFDRKGESNMPVQHRPFNKGRCIDCHDPHSSDYPKMLLVDQRRLCQTCHTMNLNYANLPYKHAPFSKGFCSDCHTPHASMTRGLTILPEEKLCFSCHYDRLAERNAAVQHKPFAQGKCVDCHGPHATSGEKLLLLPKDKICFSCHADKLRESKKGYQHDPFVKGNCSDCHVPHGSANEALTIKPQSNLCYYCHPQYKKVFQGPSSHPVGNGLLECYGCHDPHSGPGKRMTIKEGNNLCYTCHLGLEGSYEQLAHATKAKGRAGKGSCLNCHVPHSGPVRPLLPRNQDKVCGECHDNIIKRRINHPVGTKYPDAWHGGVMMCTSCHGPHGTPYKKFTLLPGDGLCIKCHGVERVKGKGYEVHRLVKNKGESKPKLIKTMVPKETR